MDAHKPTREDYLKRVNSAHDSGHLFTHMFETNIPPGMWDEKLGDMFRVMAKTNFVTYYNPYYRNQYPKTDYGMMGMATTIINKKYPIRLFSHISKTGLLLDSAKPILVNAYDSHTTVKGHLIEFNMYDPHGLLKMQGLTSDQFNMLEDTEQRFANAEHALGEYWKLLEEKWSEYNEKAGRGNALNEVNVAAELKDICGIILDDTHYATLTRDEGHDFDFEIELQKALELKQYLIANYPEQFDASLPILTYEMSRDVVKGTTPELVPLDETKIPEILAAARAGKGRIF